MTQRQTDASSIATARLDSPAIDWSCIDHVLLDMDGTVLDLAFDNHFWMQLVPQRYAAHHALTLAEATSRLKQALDERLGTLDWYCLDYWSRLTGLDIAAMKVEVRERICLLPGSEDFLRAVRASGRDLWLVTNAHSGSWQLKLAETGIGAHFHQVLSSHDFGRPKEDPEFWPALRTRCPFDPMRTLFADDNLAVLAAARDFGIREVIAIAHPDSSALPRTITRFAAVDRLPQLLPAAGIPSRSIAPPLRA